MKQYGVMNNEQHSLWSQPGNSDSTRSSSTWKLCGFVQMSPSPCALSASEMMNNRSTFVEYSWELKKSVYVKSRCRVFVLVFSTEQSFFKFFLTFLTQWPRLPCIVSVKETQPSFLMVANVNHRTTVSCWLGRHPQYPGNSILPTFLLVPLLKLLAHSWWSFSSWLTVGFALTLRATWT